MSKKVLIISTSPRKSGNCQVLSEEFAKGVIKGANQVEIININTKKIEYCRGCLACQKTGECVIKDDMKDILEKVIKSDVIVFATPIYFYEMSGQMKTFLDRTNPIFPKEYNFKDIYLIGTAADTANKSLDGALKGLKGWIDCFEKARLSGVVHGLGLEAVGDALKNHNLKKTAFDMGKNIN